MRAEKKKIDYAQHLYKTQPLSRYFIKEAYIKGGVLYYRGGDNVLRYLV